MFRTGAQLMFLTLIVGVFLMRESEREPLNAVNERFADFLAANARREEKPAPVTLVRIDEMSLREHPVPWTPGDYSLFFNTANSFQPELLATDEILDWRIPNLPPESAQTVAQYEQLLRENVRKSPRVLLGAELSYPEDADRLPPLESIAGLRKVRGEASAIPEFRVVESQASEELRLATVQGFTTLPASKSSSRSVPLLLRYCGQVVPTFVLQAAMLWERVTMDEVEVELGSHIRLGNRVNIPIDSTGRMRVNFAVPFGECSFDDLVVSAEQRDAKSKTTIPPDLLSAKAVLLSRTDRDAIRVPVVLDHSRPRGEIFVLALGTIQTRAFMQTPPKWTGWAIVAAFTIAAGFVPYSHRTQVIVLGSVAILATCVTALALIGSKLIAISVIVPIGLSIFLIVARALSADPRMIAKKEAAPANPTNLAASAKSPKAATIEPSATSAPPVSETKPSV